MRASEASVAQQPGLLLTLQESVADPSSPRHSHSPGMEVGDPCLREHRIVARRVPATARVRPSGVPTNDGGGRHGSCAGPLIGRIRREGVQAGGGHLPFRAGFSPLATIVLNHAGCPGVKGCEAAARSAGTLDAWAPGVGRLAKRGAGGAEQGQGDRRVLRWGGASLARAPLRRTNAIQSQGRRANRRRVECLPARYAACAGSCRRVCRQPAAEPAAAAGCLAQALHGLRLPATVVPQFH